MESLSCHIIYQVLSKGCIHFFNLMVCFVGGYYFEFLTIIIMCTVFTDLHTVNQKSMQVFFLRFTEY